MMSDYSVRAGPSTGSTAGPSRPAEVAEPAELVRPFETSESSHVDEPYGEEISEIDFIEDLESNLTGFVGSSYRTSYSNVPFYGNSSTGYPRSDTEHHDFMGMVTAISHVYRRGIYLKMISLDEQTWERIGRGSNFQVSRSQISFEVVSARNPAVREQVSNKLVLKRNDAPSSKLSSTQIRGFIKELRILDHFHSHPFVVDLRGVGWFMEYYDDREASPKPAILLEEATGTLDDLLTDDASIEWRDILRIFGQIVSALASIHSSRIAHGDIKPGNVLIFKSLRNFEGVQIQSYTAKLSDFESAVMDEGRDQPYPPGTEGYIAPEAKSANKTGKSADSFDKIILADIWSLGILFAVLIGGPKKILKKNTTNNSGNRIKYIRSIVKDQVEASTIETSMASDVENILHYTLQTNPASRRMDKLVDILACYQGLQETQRLPETFYALSPDALSVSYENFKHLSGAIKDKVSTELMQLCESNDARHASAMWELGVIHLTHFATPDSSAADGLQLIRRAAEAGDCRAQALGHRIHDAYSTDIQWSQETHTAMLEQAACTGHQTALEDLRVMDEASTATRAQAAHASSFYDPILIDNIETLRSSTIVSVNGDVTLHRAAATGNLDHITATLKKSDTRIEVRNHDGETPLMSACRFGQLQSALLLLEKGADASTRNRFGENCLHFAWCFDHHDAEILVRELIRQECSLKDVSRRLVPSSYLDLLPVLSGTPLERAVGRRRLDLSILFHEYDDTIEPPNGRLARRLLVWALRLQDSAHQELLLESMADITPGYDDSLTPIIDTTWLHRGERRTLLEAASAGWISGANIGYDAPVQFWSRCLVGKSWRATMQSSMTKILELEHRSSPGSEKLLDKAIQWAFSERHYDAFTRLLHMKVEWTPCQDSRREDCFKLRWVPRQENICVMRTQEAHLIDRLFYSSSRGTLAQQAFVSGDRYMFRLLTRKYLANATLPAPLPSGRRQYIGEVTYGRKNNFNQSIFKWDIDLYSMLSYTNHHDLWFARELRSLGVLLTCPWDTSPFQYMTEDKRSGKCIYITPLMHAVGSSFWAYALWLLESGASIEEKINYRHTAIAGIMATRSPEAIEFFFRGCQNRDKGAKYIPSEFREAGGYHVYRLFYDTRDIMLEVHQPDEPMPDIELDEIFSGTALKRELEDRRAEQKSQRQDATLECYKYLLRKYPNAKNTLPKYSLSPLFPRHHLSLVHQAATLCRSSNEADVLLLLIESWDARRKPLPTQQMVHYLYNSPLDRFSGPQISRLLAADRRVTLRNLAPSILWKPTLESYALIICCLLAVLFFQWMIGPTESWTSEPDTRPSSSLILAVVFVVAAAFIGRSIYLIVSQIRFVVNLRTSFNRFFLLVAVYLIVPILVVTGIALRGYADALIIKGRSGYYLIPYVL